MNPTLPTAQINGAPASAEQLQALALTGYGHFTSMLVKDQTVRGLALHLERLARDCQALFGADLAQDQLRGWLRRALQGLQGSWVVRVTLFDPALQVSRPSDMRPPAVLITVHPAPPALPPLRVQTRRYGRDQAAIKHTGLFGLIYQRRLAQRLGYDDALFVDDSGALSEGCTWNIGFFDGAQLVWPAGEALAGVTMALLSAHHRGPVIHARVTPAQLPRMVAAFATNAVSGVRPIAAIDDHRWPDAHPILATLRAAYAQIPGEHP